MRIQHFPCIFSARIRSGRKRFKTGNGRFDESSFSLTTALPSYFGRLPARMRRPRRRISANALSPAKLPTISRYQGSADLAARVARNSANSFSTRASRLSSCFVVVDMLFILTARRRKTRGINTEGFRLPEGLRQQSITARSCYRCTRMRTTLQRSNLSQNKGLC